MSSDRLMQSLMHDSMSCAHPHVQVAPLMHGLRTDEEYDSFMKDSKGQTVRLVGLRQGADK